jgi:hypothetical protein
VLEPKKHRSKRRVNETIPPVQALASELAWSLPICQGAARYTQVALEDDGSREQVIEAACGVALSSQPLFFVTNLAKQQIEKIRNTFCASLPCTSTTKRTELLRDNKRAMTLF